MDFAIIAAGMGSRLSEEGIVAPKPLVEVGGEFLVDRLIRIFIENKAEHIAVICNDKNKSVSRHLLQQKENISSVPIQVVTKTTPSSMHSFYGLSKLLEHRPFILTTVDTIFREKEFSDYIKIFETGLQDGWDGVMGVTTYIDDEKPLFVGVNEEQEITGFFDSNDGGCRYVSAGIYGLSHKSIGTLRNCINRGECHLRNFQRALIADGFRLKAYDFSKVFDVDHAVDIRKAEEFLKNEQC